MITKNNNNYEKGLKFRRFKILLTFDLLKKCKAKNQKKECTNWMESGTWLRNLEPSGSCYYCPDSRCTQTWCIA